MTAARIYLETTIPSYLVARPSKDAILRGQQEATKQWWHHQRLATRCHVSAVVEVEICGGNPTMAALRLDAIRHMPRLEISHEVVSLAARILATGLIPPKATADASHIAIAAVHGMDLLLTWNCRHIHNVMISRKLDRLCTQAGFSCPMICTPFDLLA